MSLSAATVLFAAAITPGPNNLVVMTAAARGGFAGALPPIAGIVSGTLAMVLAAQFGLNAILTQWPSGVQSVRIVAGTLMLYLGLRIALAAWAEAETDAATGNSTDQLGKRGLLWTMLLLQVVNPKTWVLAATVSATRAAQTDAMLAQLVALTIGIPGACLAIWALGGAFLAPLMHKRTPRRLFGLGAGIALGAFAIMVIISDA